MPTPQRIVIERIVEDDLVKFKYEINGVEYGKGYSTQFPVSLKHRGMMLQDTYRSIMLALENGWVADDDRPRNHQKRELWLKCVYCGVSLNLYERSPAQKNMEEFPCPCLGIKGKEEEPSES